MNPAFYHPGHFPVSKGDSVELKLGYNSETNKPTLTAIRVFNGSRVECPVDMNISECQKAIDVLEKFSISMRKNMLTSRVDPEMGIKRINSFIDRVRVWMNAVEIGPNITKRINIAFEDAALTINMLCAQ